MNTVYMTGTWDLFHQGHLNVLHRASMLGDKLIVGVVSDEFAAAMKPGRPIIPLHERCALLRELRCVDMVVVSYGFLDFSTIDRENITIRAIGPDYGRYPEQEVAIEEMRKRGIKIVRLPRTPGISTSSIIERIRNG